MDNDVKKGNKNIVLDKSYLYGKSKSDVTALCDNYSVLMIDTLFMELISGDSIVRARCFKKFPKGPNPITLIPSVSNLLQKEIELNRPSTPITSVRYVEKFKFNPKLYEEDFKISEDDKVHIAEWERDTYGELDDFREQCIYVEGFFPKLKGIHPGSRNDIITETINAIASDSDMIRDIYSSIRKDYYPSQNAINEKWAFFRWMQVHLMAAVDYFTRYGTINSPRKDALANEKLDLEYCIIGTLADGIASMEKRIKNRYKHICPSGIFIE